MFDTDFWDSLRAFAQKRVTQTGTPGVALAVVDRDQILFAEGFGVTSVDPEQSVAVTLQTVFRIGSTSKPLTGTLLMRLVDAGLLSLDEPIVTYLPWFTLSDPKAASRVTLRHLMSHQSGLPWGAEFFGSRDPEGLEEYVREKVPRLPLIAPPGVLFSYSNVGVNVSGCVAEAVGGASFADLMRTWVFQPLGMERSTYDPLRAMAFPLAQAHERTDAGIQVRRGEPWAENVAYRPSAMAYSTVRDIANLARLYLNLGDLDGQRLLSAESVAEMHRTQVDEYQVDGRTVGLNFALTNYRGYRRVSHGGGISSFGSIFTMLPDLGIAVILQFNDPAFWQPGEEIVRWVFDTVLETSPQFPLPAPTSDAPLEAEPGYLQGCAGMFLGSRSGLVTISLADKTLKLSRQGTPTEVPLIPLRHDLYKGRNESTGEEEVVGFISDAGAVTHIMLNGAPCARVEPNAAFVPVPETWRDYVGAYQGPDSTYPSGLDVLSLTWERGKLNVHSQNRARAEEAIPWDDGSFIYRGMFLRFQEGAFTLGDAVTLYRRFSPPQ